MLTITGISENDPPFGITLEDIAEFDRKQEANKMTDTVMREEGQDVWDFMLEPIPEKDSFFTPIVLDALSEDTNAEVDGDDLLDRAIERNDGHIVLSNMDMLFDKSLVRNSMRFSNSHESLDRAIENNGGHLALANMDTLFDTNTEDSMKFKNKGESLDKAIANNGGHIVLSGTNILLDKSW
jgi:hypothetical protein